MKIALKNFYNSYLVDLTYSKGNEPIAIFKIAKRRVRVYISEIETPALHYVFGMVEDHDTHLYLDGIERDLVAYLFNNNNGGKLNTLVENCIYHTDIYLIDALTVKKSQNPALKNGFEKATNFRKAYPHLIKTD